MKCLLDPEPTPDETGLFHHIYDMATEMLPEQGRIPPVVFFRAGASPQLPGVQRGLILPVGMDLPDNDDAKDCVAQALRQLTKKIDADLVLMVLESWMVKPTTPEASYFKAEGCFHVRPSQHPNRIEIVLFSVSKPGGHHWSAWVEIQRDAQGKPSIPEQAPKLEYLKVGGRFGNLFEDDDDACDQN